MSASIPNNNYKRGDSDSDDYDDDDDDDDDDQPRRKRRMLEDCGTNKTASSNERWEVMFQRLEAFREKNGHCRVPNRYQEDSKLGAWVSTQRRHYKAVKSTNRESASLTVERAARLEVIGFEWQGTNPRTLHWDMRYQSLLDFKRKYGHARVPIGWEEDIQLANWTSTQRQEYKNLLKGKTSRLDQRRINLLNDVGFAWEVPRGGRRKSLRASNQDDDHASSSVAPAFAAAAPDCGPDTTTANTVSAARADSTSRGTFASPGSAFVQQQQATNLAALAGRQTPPTESSGTGACHEFVDTAWRNSPVAAETPSPSPSHVLNALVALMRRGQQQVPAAAQYVPVQQSAQPSAVAQLQALLNRHQLPLASQPLAVQAGSPETTLSFLDRALGQVGAVNQNRAARTQSNADALQQLLVGAGQPQGNITQGALTNQALLSALQQHPTVVGSNGFQNLPDAAAVIAGANGFQNNSGFQNMHQAPLQNALVSAAAQFLFRREPTNPPPQQQQQQQPFINHFSMIAPPVQSNAAAAVVAQPVAQPPGSAANAALQHRVITALLHHVAAGNLNPSNPYFQNNG